MMSAPEIIKPGSKVFELERHLVDVSKNNSGRWYLPVDARLMWMRAEHPEWGISTDMILFDDNNLHRAIFKATITDESGRVIATATKQEDLSGFGDYMEKAETGAVGRALGMCGYGTQFMLDELDERDRIVDTPQTQSNKPAQQQSTQQPRPPQQQQPTQQPRPAPQSQQPKGGLTCYICNNPVSGGVANISLKECGRPDICMGCRVEYKHSDEFAAWAERTGD